MLAHNICCLIASIYELGLEPTVEYFESYLNTGPSAFEHDPLAAILDKAVYGYFRERGSDHGYVKHLTFAAIRACPTMWAITQEP